jgi:hypothetical protein
MPRERLHWVDFEELRSDPRGTLTRVLQFAGARTDRLEAALERVPLHAGTRSPPPPEDWAREFETLVAAARRRFGEAPMVHREPPSGPR